jgi:hypothetical protein
VLTRYICRLAGAAVWLAAAIGCGPAPSGNLDLEVRFAQMQQAQTDAGGLPLGVHSYMVQALAGGVDGTLVGGTDCIDIDADDDKRMSIKLDLPAHQVVFLVVSAFGSAGCTGGPDWRGVAHNVVIQEGKKTHVPIYVTRRGLQLNPTRAHFSQPRVFASATALDDGRVLLAGGFENPTVEDGLTRLEAACDAVLYDPGTARFSSPVPLATGCRGMHRALKLSDGRVLLAGGTRELMVDFGGVVTVRPSGDHLVTTAEVFDPETNQFSPAGSAAEIGRADPAAVAMADDKVVLLGGRTTSLRSDGILTGRQSGNTWSFSATGAFLLAPRNGARAARLNAGILVAGGNESGTDPLELIDPTSYASEPVSLSVTAPLCVFGHSLTRLSGVEVLIAGGVPDDAGAPGGGVVSISLDSSPPAVWEGALQHTRAFHAASLLEDGRVLLAGGLDRNLAARKDLEVLTPGGTSQVLTEATLAAESIGMAAALLPDGSVLLAGGLDLEAGGTVELSSTVQLLSP